MIKKIIFGLSISFFHLITFANNDLKIYNVVIPFSPGGASDVLFRFIEPKLNEELKNYNIKLVIKNVPGAGGNIGLNSVINDKNLTLGFFSPFFVINRYVRNDSMYESDSVNLLGFAGYNKMIIISKKHNTIKDIQRACTTKNIFFGSSGLGSTSYFTGYVFAKKYLNCNELIHIPYKGVSSVYPDLNSGIIDFMADFQISANSFIDKKYFNKIIELTSTDILSWHIFVSNKIDDSNINIIKNAFNNLKKDDHFSKLIEEKFFIQNFSDIKDEKWLLNEFKIFEKNIKNYSINTVK